MEKFLIFLMGILLIALISIILGLPTMLLWNWLIPGIFGLTKITFLEAIGLNILCGILFKASNNNK